MDAERYNLGRLESKFTGYFSLLQEYPVNKIPGFIDAGCSQNSFRNGHFYLNRDKAKWRTAPV